MGVIPFAMFAVHLLLAGNGFQADGISASAYGIAASVSYLTLLFCQYANIMSRRVGQSSVFQSYIFSNKKLWISIAISLFLVSLLLYVPAISGMV
jgi:magnesium-transporting ATPase (P-type)